MATHIKGSDTFRSLSLNEGRLCILTVRGDTNGVLQK